MASPQARAVDLSKAYDKRSSEGQPNAATFLLEITAPPPSVPQGVTPAARRGSASLGR
jgi:hypothetical protein